LFLLGHFRLTYSRRETSTLSYFPPAYKRHRRSVTLSRCPTLLGRICNDGFENGKTLLRQTIISASLGGLASISSFISLPAVALYSGGLFTYQAALLDSKDPGFHSNLATVSRFYDLLQENEPTHELVLNPGYSTGLEGTAFQTPDRFREQL